MIKRPILEYGIQLLVWMSFLAGRAANAESVGVPVPSQIDDRNVAVTFTVDTTWHTVHGNLSHITGKAWYADPQRPESLGVEIEFPVAYFDTANRSRDKELHESMNADAFPVAQLTIHNAPTICPANQISETVPCHAVLAATLTIKDVAKNLDLPTTISRTDTGFQAEGGVAFNWLEFGISDPSILVARVDKVVRVDFHVDLLDSSGKTAKQTAAARSPQD